MPCHAMLCIMLQQPHLLQLALEVFPAGAVPVPEPVPVAEQRRAHRAGQKQHLRQ
jgi:hypothetical protein